jgi:predicted helicase
MQHFLKFDNLGLIAARQITEDFDIYITKCIAGHKTCSAYDKNNVFPLYLCPEKDTLNQDEKRRPNLNMKVVNELAEKINLRFTEEKEETADTFAPIDILDYIYAVLHSPSYREKYREFLKIDFPRVPYPVSAASFRTLSGLGASLRKIHLLEGVENSSTLAAYPIDGTNQIDTLTYQDEKVWINKKQHFDAVPPEVWNFYIGGYQPAQKWLKDRKNRTLNYDDIQHYQKIVTALQLTIDLQVQIDEHLYHFMEQLNENIP